VKDDSLYLSHIRDAIDRALGYTQGGKTVFMGDGKTQDAVVRNLEIIGEAVKKLSDAARAGRPQVPWKRIAGMRDKVIHDYFGVDLNLVWDVVERELPALRGHVEAMLSALGKR
jgi:uncharacterized protein with HEPN domain